MWGEDFDGRDVLDVHTTAAYKYATVKPSRSENKRNSKDELFNDGKKKLHAATFSDVNKKKLVSLLKETTGVDSTKRRKKAKKTKGIASGGLASPGKVAPTKIHGIATRRIPAAYNDDVYRMLDGSTPETTQMVQAFDHNNLTHLELYNVGVQKVIPSEAKHNQTYIQQLVSPSAMLAAGTHFKKSTDLKGAISLSAKQQTVSKMPEWLDLRDNYMRQVHICAAKIIAATKEGDTHLLGASTKQHFALLLNAQRKVTLRILQEYDYQMGVYMADVENDSVQKTLRSLEEYLVDVPNCLDYINKEPFLSWLGLETTMNPLLTIHRLDGAPALHSNVQGAATRVHPVLEMNEDEMDQSLDLSALLWRIYKAEQLRPKRPFRSKGATAKTIEDWSDSDSEEGEASGGETSVVLLYRDETDDDRIKLLIKQTDKTMHNTFLSRERKVFQLGLAPLKTYWKMWRQAYKNNWKVSTANCVRGNRNLRICFDKFVHNVWQSQKFRSLQQNYHRRIAVITFGAWNEYRLWCKRFQNLFKRSTKHILRYRFDVLKLFVYECHDVRTFRRKSKGRIYRAVFQAFLSNARLSKFELKKRLERRSTISFQDRFICQRSFAQWKARNRVIAKLDDLHDFVDRIELKQAVVRWVLLTFGPRSQRRARSISKAKAFMSTLRDSFEKKATSTYRYISDSLSAISPLVSSKDKQKMQQDRYEGGEAKRKLRIKQALEYSQKIDLAAHQAAVAATEAHAEAAAKKKEKKDKKRGSPVMMRN